LVERLDSMIPLISSDHFDVSQARPRLNTGVHQSASDLLRGLEAMTVNKAFQ